ncbi:MAG: hypothetical protein ACO3U3_14585, partial [Alphaproteobacteria bacterium]
YEIKSELKVRKWLESNTDYTFEFIRNDEQKGYDLGCWKYIQKGDIFEKHLICFIEVEESEQWKNGQYPSHWRYWAYLQRKVNPWDWDLNAFLTGLKKDATRTMYLKAAIDFSGVHCSRMEDIYAYGKLANSGTHKNDRLSMTYRFSVKSNSQYVFVGKERCLRAIKRFIDIQSKLQPIEIKIAE